MTLPFPEPASLAPTLALARCGPADVPEMMAVYLAAFGPTDLSYWWPAEGRDTMRPWLEARYGAKFGSELDQLFKVVDRRTGAVAAWARWSLPERMRGGPMSKGFVAHGEEGEGATGGQHEHEHRHPPQQLQAPPEGVNRELYDEFFGGIKMMADKWGTGALDLSVICAHPAYQGMGLGSALLQPVLGLADAEGVTTYLEAASKAVPFYQKHGFVKVDELRYDLTRAGLQGNCVLSVMIRPPKEKGQAS